MLKLEVYVVTQFFHSSSDGLMR